MATATVTHSYRIAMVGNNGAEVFEAKTGLVVAVVLRRGQDVRSLQATADALCEQLDKGGKKTKQTARG